MRAEATHEVVEMQVQEHGKKNLNRESSVVCTQPPRLLKLAIKNIKY
jgi:hypothetical protein